MILFASLLHQISVLLLRNFVFIETVTVLKLYYYIYNIFELS